MIHCDEGWTTELLRELVAIDSVNPTVVEGAAGEAQAAARVAAVLRDVGLEVRTLEPEPGRVSVVGRWAGAGEGRSLLLNGHLDTVGVEGMEDPFGARVEGGRLHGRGAYDMKGGFVACLAAVRALREAGHEPAGDLVILAAADEEAESLGTRAYLETPGPDGPPRAAIVTEPTELAPCVAHKGFAWIELAAEGRAAHGSRQDLGVDANLRMARALARLAPLRDALEEREPHPLLGRPSLHVGTLRGGTAPSVYAARSTATVERRTLPGESVVSILAEVRAALAGVGPEGPVEGVTARLVLERPPFRTDPEAPLVRTLREVLRRRGARARPVGNSVWMDAALFAEAGMDTVVIGPSGEGAHADEEWVELASVHRLAEVLAETALAWCGEAG